METSRAVLFTRSNADNPPPVILEPFHTRSRYPTVLVHALTSDGACPRVKGQAFVELDRPLYTHTSSMTGEDISSPLALTIVLT